jgi:hypothetical protein
MGRSAGSGLRSLRKLGEGGALVIASKARCGPIPLRLAYVGAPRVAGLSQLHRRGAQRFPRSLLKAFGLRMPWGVMIPVINSGGVTSKPGLRAVLVGLAIRT